MLKVQGLHPVLVRENQYPLWGIIAVMVLNFVSPFLSQLLVYPAFAICVYRIFRYDERVFATDYAILSSISLLFRTTGGMSMLVYLSLFAAVWYFLQSGIRGDSTYVLLIILLNYLLLRMQWNFTQFLLCFGQLFMLCILLPKQDTNSVERTAKAFCLGMVVSSAYALLLRNTSQLRAIVGIESAAIWGTTILRFQSLFADPNYYMTFLITGLALLLKLKDCGKMKALPFWTMCVCMVGFGILTYSKTFFLALVLLVGIFILWQFWNRQYLRGGLVVMVVVMAAAVLLLAEDSPFAVVLERLSGASNLDDFTTGRIEVFGAYLDKITADPVSLFFGQGLDGQGLFKDPHNLFLEITYYTGLVGLVLYICFYGAMVYVAKKKTVQCQGQHWVAKYVVIIMLFVVYNTLHGMFTTVSYGGFFLAVLSLMLVKKEEEVCERETE